MAGLLGFREDGGQGVVLAIASGVFPFRPDRLQAVSLVLTATVTGGPSTSTPCGTSVRSVPASRTARSSWGTAASPVRPSERSARTLAYLAANGAGQCGPCRFGRPAVADHFTALADGRAAPGLLDRLRRRIGLLPGRGACRQPDCAARLAASALTAFPTDVDHHLAHGHCRRSTFLRVPLAISTEQWT